MNSVILILLLIDFYIGGYLAMKSITIYIKEKENYEAHPVVIIILSVFWPLLFTFIPIHNTIKALFSVKGDE